MMAALRPPLSQRHSLVKFAQDVGMAQEGHRIIAKAVAANNVGGLSLRCFDIACWHSSETVHATLQFDLGIVKVDMDYSKAPFLVGQWRQQQQQQQQI